MVVPSTAAARCGPSASAASSGRFRRCTGPRPTAAARTTAATPSGWHACWRAATSSRCGSPTSALEDARDDLQHAKQRMSKFLLRHGLVFDETTPAGRRRGAWTGAYWDWTESLSFDEPDDAAAYEHYMDGNDLVENPRTVYVAGDVDELVEHEQPRGRHVVQQFRQRSLALRVAELENQLRGLPEPDRHVRGDRAHREGDCHARLAAPGLTEEDEVFARLFVSTAN